MTLNCNMMEMCAGCTAVYSERLKLVNTQGSEFCHLQRHRVAWADCSDDTDGSGGRINNTS